MRRRAWVRGHSYCADLESHEEHATKTQLAAECMVQQSTIQARSFSPDPSSPDPVGVQPP